MIYKSFTSLLLGAFITLSGIAEADYLTLPESAQTAQLSLPQRGDSRTKIIAYFGQPTTRHTPVSQNAPSSQSPITRWDYPGFTVVFENQWVVHAFAKPRL